MNTKLKAKEQLFCMLMAQAYSPCEAASRAGYRLNIKSKADRLLARADIREEISRVSERGVKRDAAAGYSRIAYGEVADAVRLCFADTLPEDIDSLDLYLVSEIKRTKTGTEIKFFDRVKALDRLCELTAVDNDRAEPFYRALEQGARRLAGED